MFCGVPGLLVDIHRTPKSLTFEFIGAARHLLEIAQGGSAEGGQGFTVLGQGDQSGVGGGGQHFIHPVLHVPDQRGDHDIGMGECCPAGIGCGKAPGQFVETSVGLAKAAVKPVGASMFGGMEVPLVDHRRDLFEGALSQCVIWRTSRRAGPEAGISAASSASSSR